MFKYLLIIVLYLHYCKAQCPGTLEGPEGSDACYEIHAIKRSYSEAYKQCKKSGGQLPEIEDKLTNMELSELLGLQAIKTSWLGGFKIFRKWKWSDGLSFNYTNWANDEQENGNHYCLTIETSSGKWSTTKCRSLHSFVCHVPILCPKDWVYYPPTDRCFYFITQLESRHDAQAGCEKWGANLASIHTDDENRFLSTTMMKDNADIEEGSFAWIGLSLDVTRWSWADKTTVDYTNFGDQTLASDLMYVTLPINTSYMPWQAMPLYATGMDFELIDYKYHAICSMNATEGI